MRLKSILRAVWPFRRNSGPTDLADLVRGVAPASTPFLDRLTSRRDWHGGAQMRNSEPLPVEPAPVVAPWDTHSPDHTPFWTTPLGSPLANARLIDPNFPKPPAWTEEAQRATSPAWPATDDPYAKPEPCDVVQDPGLCTIRDYAKRVNANTAELTDTIDRQEAAEKLLRIMGWQWDKNQKSWQAPNL